MDIFAVWIITCIIMLSSIKHSMTVEIDYLWPLNYPFYGYETKQCRESLHPSQDRTIPYLINSNTYLNVSSALVFNRDKYIDVRIDNSVPFSTMTFNIFLKATLEVPRNVIAHYKANSPKPNTIREFIMEGNDKDLTVTYTFNDGTQEEVTCGGDIEIDKWNLYTIMQKNADEKLFVYVDLDHNHDVGLNNFPTNLNTPGILRFGGHQSITNIGFIGEMCCATLLNEEIPLVMDSIVSVCNNVPSGPPDDTLIWPLDTKALGYEVKTNTVPSTRLTAFQFKPGPAELPNEAIYFDGWPLSKIITNISSERLQNEFEISFYISTMCHSVGTILQIASNQVPPIGIINLKLEIIVNGTKLTVKDASGLCGNIVVTDMPLPWSWRVLAIQRTTNDLFLTIENTTYHAADTCTPASSVVSSDDMTMTIGGGSLIEEGFKGQMRCLAVFDYAFQLPTALVTKCTSADVTKFNTLESLVTSNIVTTKQKLLMINKRPPLEIQSDAINFKFTRSLSDCGRKCLAEDKCRSYTYNRQTRQCVIYTLFVIEELIPANGENYYGVTFKE